MAKIFLITESFKYKQMLSGYEIKTGKTFAPSDFDPDIVVIDYDILNSKMVLLEAINQNLNKEFEVFCLISPDKIAEIKGTGAKAILKPVNKDILMNEISYTLQNKAQIKALHEENQELKKNLYQIDAFYSASSKFAGTLDKEKLYEVTIESLERILSFDIACTLLKDNFQDEKLKFYINSIKKTTDQTNSNLIKRLAIAAKDEGLAELKPSRYEVEIIQNTKPSYKNEYYDPALTGFDTLMAPITVKDKFEGIIEIFRKTPFTKEDITCFQSIIHQVLAPLRSAILYEDIKNANTKLKKLEKMKSEFVSIVSHELRTPLTPINNALSIILSEEGGKIGETNKNFANIAKRNVSRLSGIIEDLLDLSRMQTGKFDFKFKKAELNPSLSLCYNTFKNQVGAKNIEFTLDIEKNLPNVYIDSHRIDQILSNLVTNAIKFTNENGKIEISAKTVSDIDKDKLVLPGLQEYKGEYVQISVKDTGVGIEKENLPKIFDKFSQIENTLSRSSGGIGLGLTITKHFIDAHLGGIWVESVKNEGSTFNVIIPVYSDTIAFEAELNLKIKTENNVAYLKIEEAPICSFYEDMKNLNIIKLTKNSKELVQTIGKKRVSRVFMPAIDRSAFEFMISKIEEEADKNKTCDIVLSKAYYKKENS